MASYQNYLVGYSVSQKSTIGAGVVSTTESDAKVAGSKVLASAFGVPVSQDKVFVSVMDAPVTT